MPTDNLLSKFWRQLRFDVPRVTTHAASRKRVGAVVLAASLLIVVFSAFYGSIALFEYKFGGGLAGLVFVAIMYALAFGLRKGLKNSGNAVVLGIKRYASAWHASGNLQPALNPVDYRQSRRV